MLRQTCSFRIYRNVKNPMQQKHLRFDRIKVIHTKEDAWTSIDIADTPAKFNIAPEKSPSQKDSSLPTIIFQGLC